MSINRVSDDNRGNVGRSATIFSPDAQNTTNDPTLVDAVIDCVNSSLLSITIKNTGANSLDWKVLGGNTSDIAEAVELKANATLTAGSYGTYTSSALVWRYVGVYVESTVDGNPGQATIYGIAKG